MSFFTSLTGLDAANADLGIISNNIANVSTYGFKQSSAQFGDIYATSPLQNATSTIGQGVLLKGVTQDFSQGNITSSSNSLDMAIQGQGFFMLKPSLTSNTQVYTRDGSFSVNNNRYVVDSAGQYLQVFPVNSDGSVVATGLDSAESLQLPTTSGLPKATSQIQLGVNLPSDATVIPQESTYTSGGATYAFDPNNANTYNQSTSITVYDSLGNPSIATIYYVKTSNATPADPTNKWQTYIYVGGNQINPALLGAQDSSGAQEYINQFGQTTTDPSAVDPTFNATAPHALYYQDDQNTQVPSQAASFTGGIVNSTTGTGFNFGSTDSNTIVVGASDQSSTQSGTWIQPTAGQVGEEYNLSISTPAGSTSPYGLSLLDSVATATTGTGSTLSSTQLDQMLNSQSYTLLSGYSTPTSTVNLATGSTSGSITVSNSSGTATIGVSSGESLASLVNSINTNSSAQGLGIMAQLVNTNAGTTATPSYAVQIYTSTNSPTPNAYQYVASNTDATTPITNNIGQFTVGGVTIAGYTTTGTNNTLATIAANINTTYGSQGVNASVVTANGQATLVVTSNTNTFTVSSNGVNDGSGTTDAVTANDSAANQLKNLYSIGTTGSITNGNLTLYSLNGTSDPTFNINVNQNPTNYGVYGVDSLGGIAGGFTGTQFAQASSTVGSGTQSEQGVSTAQLFKIAVDGSDPVEVSLPSSLDGQALTGEQLASALTTAVNNAFGDQQYIDLSSTNNSFNITASFDPNVSGTPMQTLNYTNPYGTNGSQAGLSTAANSSPNSAFESSAGVQLTGTQTVSSALSSKYGIQIVLPPNQQYTPTSLVAAAQQQVDANIGANHIQVGYDSTTRSLTFKPYNNSDGITNIGVTGPLTTTGGTTVIAANDTLGMPEGLSQPQSVGAGSTQGTAESGALVPNGAPAQNIDQRRYGVQVVYQKDTGTFQFLSGSTGENSSISVTPAGNERGANLLGISSTYTTQFSSTAGSGLPSTAAVTTGAKATIDISGTFAVTSSDNTIDVTVDGVQGQVVIPPGAYTGTTFASAIQTQINEITNASGQSVGGVTVTYNPSTSNFTFTSGTTGTGSIINVVGPAAFGLASATQTQGTVPNVTVLKQATDSSGNLLYIDSSGNETTNKPANLPNWTPLYLTPGELTFNTAGNLISPQQGAQYTPYDPQNGANPITLNVNYGKYSTQYSQPFSVLSLSQDGYTSGSLSGINIDSTGVVRATYTNGQQQALGKVVLANFSSPTGLKQLGNSDYTATSLSGPPTTGEAGSSGFGTIQGGALEESNVDMTSELVDLITAQRNFQANAKAIETDTQLTSTIINIRS